MKTKTIQDVFDHLFKRKPHYMREKEELRNPYYKPY